MSRYISVDDMRGIFCQSKSLTQAWDGFDMAPSIDIESNHGEWIRDRYWSRGVGMGEEYGFFYKCSLCEYEVENGYTRCGFNFCPYCGADMRKESE